MCWISELLEGSMLYSEGLGADTNCVLHSPPSPSPVLPKPSATSATLELDRLMASLSDFRVQNHVNQVGCGPVRICGFPTPCRTFHTCCLADSTLMSSSLQLPASGSTQPPVPSSVNEGSPSSPGPASKGSLDTMLGLLQSDLSRRGVPTQTKGLCGSCNKPIAGQVSGALWGGGRGGGRDPWTHPY